MRRAARHLESQVCILKPADFTELQQALGITHHQHSLLLDRSLDEIVDPSDAYLHDWQHGLFVDGVVPITVYLLFEDYFQSGKKDIYAEFSSYVQLWSWPGRLHASNLHEIFSRAKQDKHRDAHHIKRQASDMLSLMGVQSSIGCCTLGTI